MKLIEGVDYRVRYVEFPNTGSPSVAVSNGDGTYTVYVNTRFSIEEQARGLRHELEHLERSGDDLAALESAADGLLKLVPPSGRSRRKRSGGRDIPLYAAGDELLEDILNRVSPESLRLLREAGLIPNRGDDTAQ